MEEQFLLIDVSSTNSRHLNLSENAAFMSLQFARHDTNVGKYHRWQLQINKL